MSPIPASPPDIPHPLQAPDSWQPSDPRHVHWSQQPWSSSESGDAARAAAQGLEEMVAFLELVPGAVAALQDDAVQAFLDFSYAAANTPALQARARSRARGALDVLLTRWLGRDASSVRGDEFSVLLMLAGYAFQLYSSQDPRLRKIIHLCNAAGLAHGSCTAGLAPLHVPDRGAPSPSIEVLHERALDIICVVEGTRVPGLRLPQGAEEWAAAAWKDLCDYPLHGAGNGTRGLLDRRFYESAYLATHIGYVPTGCGRHRLCVEDAPHLYPFIRENFFSVLELGELDLAGEFVDLLRQYGCTAESDFQVRAGTRFLLELYHAAGDSWVGHRDGGTEKRLDAYTLIHKPWTGAGGVRDRRLEPISPGTYGSAFRRIVGARTVRAHIPCGTPPHPPRSG